MPVGNHSYIRNRPLFFFPKIFEKNQDDTSDKQRDNDHETRLKQFPDTSIKKISDSQGRKKRDNNSFHDFEIEQKFTPVEKHDRENRPQLDRYLKCFQEFGFWEM